MAAAGIDAPMGARHLPHAVEYPADGQAVDEAEAGFWREGHGDFANAQLLRMVAGKFPPEYQPDMSRGNGSASTPAVSAVNRL